MHHPSQVSQLTLTHKQGYSELQEMPLLALTFQKTKYYSLMSPLIEEAIELSAAMQGIYLMPIVNL